MLFNAQDSAQTKNYPAQSFHSAAVEEHFSTYVLFLLHLSSSFSSFYWQYECVLQLRDQLVTYDALKLDKLRFFKRTKDKGMDKGNRKNTRIVQYSQG